MKTLYVLFFAFTLAAATSAAPIGNFTLQDQHQKSHTYHFPRSKPTVISLSDRKGSEQVEPWVRKLAQHYGKRIHIDGLADMSTLPKPLRGMVRGAMKRKLSYPVMLDFEGTVVKKFKHSKGVVNLYLLDRKENVIKTISGPLNDQRARTLFAAIDKAI